MGVLYLTVAALALAQTAPPLPKMTPQKIAQSAIPSIALIKTRTGLGTGFVVRDGRIATNLHVIEGADDVAVTLDDKELEDVRVVASDVLHDLVVLSVKPGKMRALPLGDSDGVQAGQEIVAIGHPLGLGNTVSNGLVSGIREVQPGLKMLQVSAPISQGSSGGPLIDEHGQVVGISTLLITRGQNLGFGMPVNYLKELLEQPEKPLKISEFAKQSEKQAIKREVPSHDLSLVDDCSKEDLAAIEGDISRAIGLGAPLYNEGNHEACFRIYEGTALDLSKKLKRCKKATGALLDGVKRAGTLEGATAKAWAMRDAFDGMLDVIDRKLSGVPALPKSPVREVPNHDLGLLKNCSKEQVDDVHASIVNAIEVGAPLYNQGQIDACYRIYQGAALDLTRRLKKCVGPKKALKDGLDRAGKLKTPDQRAWAMRDTFDGLLDVIERAR